MDDHISTSVGDVAFGDNLQRNVFCILGVPIDVIDLSQMTRCVYEAALNSRPLFLSTPNLNFLDTSWHDAEFRESLLDSDLCPPDGMPVVWLGRLLGVPVRERLAGSDIFAFLRTQKPPSRRLRLFFFGGDEGVAEAAAKVFNSGEKGARCVGWLYPGYRPVEEMSTDAIIDVINASGADFLVVALGARKGQAWLMRNAGRLRVPVRAHFGASLNFEAGRLRRAPEFLQRSGLEWLWRIKEEPFLWRRYLDDGLAVLRALAANVAPLLVHGWIMALSSEGLGIRRIAEPSGAVAVALSGPATIEHIDRLIEAFGGALNAVGTVTLDMSRVTTVDSRFLGLLILFRRKVRRAKLRLVIVGVSDRLRRQFQRHKSEFLIAPEAAADLGAPSPGPQQARILSGANSGV